jgi:CHC2 zinc finger
MSENNDLRAKIDEAKRRLPLPDLMAKLGLGDRAKKNARCPFHDDQNPSFSVFHDGWDDDWYWKCHASCGEGDEIDFLVKHEGISRREAIKRYLDIAGFPAHVPDKSHEYPKPPHSRKSPVPPGCPEPPKSPKCLGYPVSEGQGLEEELKALAARDACTQHTTAKKGLWQLARDLRAMDKRIGRKLANTELMLTFGEWHRLSQPFLDPQKTRDDYLAAFLAKPAKVRIPTGEGDTLNKALEAISKLSPSELPMIPGMPDTPESWRRVAALHRELSRRCANKTYFLSCRDTAKAHPGLRHQSAYDINLALAQLGVIEIVQIGDARPNGKASKFRYPLAQTEDGAPQAENGRDASKDGEGQNADDWDTC